jgi:hypothetical protein
MTMVDLLRKIPCPRTLAAAAAGLLLYSALGFLVAPGVIERGIPRYVEENLQRRASMGGVSVNPLLFKVEIRDFALTERDGAPIAGFERLLVNFELSSLLRWAWTFSEIALDGLDLRLDIAPDGTLNLAALADSFPKSEGAPAEHPPRLLIQRVTLNRGSIVFTDRSLPTAASASVGPLDLEMRDFSTVPDRHGEHTVVGRLPGGATLTWRGEMSLRPISSRGDVSVTGGRPGAVWGFLQSRLNLTQPAGEIDFGTRYRFDYVGGAPQLELSDLRLSARGIALSQPDAKEPMLALERIDLTGGRFDLAARELELPRIEIEGGAVSAAIDERGVLNWQTTAGETASTKRVPGESAPGQPWKVKLKSVSVGKIALRASDRSRAAPVSASIGVVSVGFAAELEARNEGVQVSLQDLSVKLARVDAREAQAPDPIVALDSIALEGGSVDLDQRRIAIQRVTVRGGSVNIVRDKEGGLRLLEVLAAADRGSQQRPPAAASRAAAKPAQPWSVALDALEVSGVRVALADRSFDPAAAYDLENVRIGVKNVRTDGKHPATFEASLRVAQGGTLRAAGSFGMDGRRAAASVKVERVSLKPLQPMAARYTSVRLESGDVSAAAKFDYRAGASRPELRVMGSAALDNLLVNESASGERLLSWRSLAADGVSFGLRPDSLRVDEVRLLEPGARIVIFKDRGVNLFQAFRPQGTAAPGSPAPAKHTAPAPEAPGPAAGAVEPAAAAAPPFDVAVDRVRVENGIVDFADLGLVLPFAAKIEEFQGSATGISSNAASGAALKLEGRVGEFGLARVDGTLKPFQPKEFTDIGVVFRNVEMLPLSPYTATFAGRRIASGRLQLDLRYRIENSNLAGDNRVALEKFTLGERVEAPGALNLPYDLAIALLTDANGRIDVAIPVSGNVDRPDFSYGHLIWQAIATVITNIVTAPFRWLAGLFGGSGESPEYIAFEPGRATIQPPEREKLKRVAEVLGKRPRLLLVVEGHYGEADRAALREREVAAAIAGKLGRAPAAGALPEPVNPFDARTQRAMEVLFTERSSAEALARFAAETEAARGKPVRRVSPVLALVGQGSADTAFYEALLKRLNDTARIPEDAPGKLADARARAVAEHFVQTLGVPAARVVAKAAAAPDAERVRLAFDVVPRPAAAPQVGYLGQAQGH